jgi:hypothetical protein
VGRIANINNLQCIGTYEKQAVTTCVYHPSIAAHIESADAFGIQWVAEVNNLKGATSRTAIETPPVNRRVSVGAIQHKSLETHTEGLVIRA